MEIVHMEPAEYERLTEDILQLRAESSSVRGINSTLRIRIDVLEAHVRQLEVEYQSALMQLEHCRK